MKSFPYEDIIDLPHHRPSGRTPMPIRDRAAQFAPFAALSGYDACAQKANYSRKGFSYALVRRDCTGTCQKEA